MLNKADFKIRDRVKNTFLNIYNITDQNKSISKGFKKTL